MFFNGGDNPNLLHWPVIKKALSPGCYTHLYAASYYRWPVDHLVRLFKYGHPCLAPVLANWLIDYGLPVNQPLPQALLPVPISLWRFSQRQYHQTQLLAKHLSNRLEIPIIKHWSKRRGWQPKQQSLGRRARLQNLTKAYELTDSTLPKRVAIIDDVITTGATVATLSRLLWRQDPQIHIEVWAIAVTPLTQDDTLLAAGRTLK